MYVTLYSKLPAHKKQSGHFVHNLTTLKPTSLYELHFNPMSSNPKPETRNPKPTPPESLDELHISDTKDVAAGIPSILSVVHHAREEMGLFKGMRLLSKVNQQDGFDCPGCAWPDPSDHRSGLGEYCENGAKAVAEEATKKRITPEFFKQHSINELAEQQDYWLGKQGRLTHPMVLREGATHYEPITWDGAFEMIGSHLKALDEPDQAAFYTSGRTSNEAAFLYQLFGRTFGTNNFPDCSNMCHESSGVALTEVIGIGKGTVTLEDFYQAQTIIVIGQNPGTNHPRMLSALQKAKRNGCKIIHINPLPETGLKRFKHPQEVFRWLQGGTALSDQFVQVRINGDVAFLKGVMKRLLELDETAGSSVLDYPFIDNKTEGFASFLEDLKQEDWDTITQESGVPLEEISVTAQHIASTNRIIICWAMGLTQHKNAVSNIQSCVNLLLMKGSIGKPGAGACPVRGHSNVQGDRTVGITPNPKPAFLDTLESNFDIQPPRNPGLDTVDAIRAMHAGKVKTFIALGGNFLSATPDTLYTAQALQACDLTVQISTKLNRSHLITGKQALILPCLGRTEVDIQDGKEQSVSVENSMGIVHLSKGQIEPASEHLLSEIDIVARLAKATLPPNKRLTWTDWSANYDLIRDTISVTIPGFESYNERVHQPNGFYLPNGPREGIFKTDTGKAKFTLHAIPKHTLAVGEYMMMTIRSHDQFNTTIYGLDDRYRGLKGERRVILMNPEDMEEANLTERQVVHLHSDFEGETRTAPSFYVVPFPIARRCVATYFPETNVLVPINSTAERSNTPTSKSIVITIEPAS